MKIHVTAKPLAKEQRVEKTGEYTFSVSVKEPPKEGKANRAIISALADYFSIPQSSIRLVSGFSSKQKVFEIPLSLTRDYP
ncbi:MAG: DUF167 domain-containing protein [Candidatus Wildermuthbacteria bacterium]|nr:DUF167 domain-containing protein [Candidatus Wildermuthbacteria bacterium]